MDDESDSMSRRSILKRTAQAGAVVGLVGSATGSASATNCRYEADVDLGCKYEETDYGCEVHGTLTVWKVTWPDGGYRSIREKVMDYGCSHYDPLYPGPCSEVTDSWISAREQDFEEDNEDALNPC